MAFKLGPFIAVLYSINTPRQSLERMRRSSNDNAMLEKLEFWLVDIPPCLDRLVRGPSVFTEKRHGFVRFVLGLRFMSSRGVAYVRIVLDRTWLVNDGSFPFDAGFSF